MYESIDEDQGQIEEGEEERNEKIFKFISNDFLGYFKQKPKEI